MLIIIKVFGFALVDKVWRIKEEGKRRENVHYRRSDACKVLVCVVYA